MDSLAGTPNSKPIMNPDPELDRCQHCLDAGIAPVNLAAWVMPVSDWLSQEGTPCRGDSTIAICQECYDAVSGCPCMLLHSDDIYHLSKDAINRHWDMVDANLDRAAQEARD